MSTHVDDPGTLTCTSRITRVTVYARGAEVVRAVELPASGLPAGSVTLLVPDVTALADPDSLRAAPRGERSVGAVTSELVVPGGTQRGESAEQVRRLEIERAELEARRNSLGALRATLLAARPTVGIDGRSRTLEPAARLRDALEMAHLVGDRAADFEGRITALDEEIERNGRALAAARLAAEQASGSDRAAGDHPTRTLRIALAGEGALDGLEVSYVVRAARWWPAYTADLGDGTARLALEAVVAQLTLEDWDGVALRLSTADLGERAVLPRLPALRLGRARPRPRSGFRPADAGGPSELYRGYDEAQRRLAPPRPAPAPAAATVEVMESGVAAAPPPFPAAVPAPQQGVLSPAPEPPRAMKAAAARSRAEHPAEDAMVFASAEPAPMDIAPAAEVPADEWLRFDALRMAGSDDGAQRGTLVRRSGGVPDDLLAWASSTVERAAAPAEAVDPSRSRGQFDHRYDARGTVDVPSSGRPHRVEIDRADAPTRQRFRCVPAEADDVFREAVLANPFPGPLLEGPLDVVVDGRLVRSTRLDTVDRGGETLLGLGAEEHLRVARNVRVQEDTRGMLGGTTAVRHDVTIEVVSALGHDADVEVLDRVPVSDTDGVEITLVSSEPPAQPYDQQERGAPVRGGRRWQLEVPAGGTAVVRYVYEIRMSGKDEIVGGNHRG